MTPVTIVGLAMGALLILTTAFVFVSKKDFSASGVAVAIVGLVAIGMSQWTSIKISAAGTTLELQAKIEQTAAAADSVAAEVERAAAAIDATQQQVASLTNLVEKGTAVSPKDLARVRESLANAPRPDIAHLERARTDLRAVRPSPP